MHINSAKLFLHVYYIILIRFKLNMKAWHEMYLLVRDIAVDSFRVGAVPGGDVVVS